MAKKTIRCERLNGFLMMLIIVDKISDPLLGFFN